MVADNTLVHRVNPLDDPHWDDTIASLPGVSFFHTAAWARVLRDTYQFRPVYFVVKSHGDSINALVPLMEVDSWLTGRRGISLPFTDECTPLGSEPRCLQAIFRAIEEHGEQRRWKYWEVRGGIGALDAPPSTKYYGHLLHLCREPAYLLAACEGAARWAVRKAEQTQLKVSFSHDLDTVRAFHDLVCTTRKRHGLPPQPLRFFENIHRHVLSRGKGCIVLARLNESPVAGSMFLHFGKAAIFKFGASDAAFHHLRPNNLVMWRAIEWHARAGFESLDFGRTSVANKGLRHFKLGWGTAEREIAYARFDLRAAAFVPAPDHASGWHNRVFKILPRAVARALGAAAYKHVA